MNSTSPLPTQPIPGDQNKDAAYDIAIVGAGISGTALLYVLSHYTDVKRIALIEKCEGAAQINSYVSNNSQTLHFGDIETNYSLEKAKKVNKAASLVKNYLLQQDSDGTIHSKYHKMVLAVGADQVQMLRQRYEQFKSLFPDLRLIDRDEISQLEPNILKDRSEEEEVVALFTESGYTVNFQRLAQSFLDEVQTQRDRPSFPNLPLPTIDTYFGTKVNQIHRELPDQEAGNIQQQDTQRQGQYQIQIDDKTLNATVVVVAAGAHSLLFAKSLGYGKDFALLSVAGSFFMAPKALNGKVYTLQLQKLPFAAIHGDPEVHDSTVTRFGPTAKVLPLLERHNWRSLYDYLQTAGLSIMAFLSFFKILSDPFMFKYILRNLIYDLPWIGRRLFIQEVRKIIPSLQLKDLRRAIGYGGIRPQIVNMKTRSLQMGEAKIFGDNIIFNITPSPGASTCLQNAEDDVEKIMEFLGETYRFDRQKFWQDLGVAETAQELTRI